MHPTAQGTARYADRFPEFSVASFYRTTFSPRVFSLGIGTCLGESDDAADLACTGALIAAGEGGINFFDFAINHRHRRNNPETQLGFRTREELGEIRWYGAVTWAGFRKNDDFSLKRLAEIAAARLGIAFMASATLLQSRSLANMPDTVQALLPGLAGDAQRAIQFTHSPSGVGVAGVSPVGCEQNLRRYQ